MKKTFRILKIKKLSNSIYGNPCYRLIVEDENGEILTGKTAANAMIGYEVTDTWEGEKKVFTYHYTKSGSRIFDRLTTNEEAKNAD